MKKNGFTLIELLAVIAILAIIMLIAVPQITGVITKARVDSNRATARSALKLAGDMYTRRFLGDTATAQVFSAVAPGTTAVPCVDAAGLTALNSELTKPITSTTMCYTVATGLITGSVVVGTDSFTVAQLQTQ